MQKKEEERNVEALSKKQKRERERETKKNATSTSFFDDGAREPLFCSLLSRILHIREKRETNKKQHDAHIS